MPLLSMSQMIGYPTQCPSISMFDTDTARTNAHYWVLHLISHNFGPGDKLVATRATSPDIDAQASITAKGRRLFLVNTCNNKVTVNLADAFTTGGLVAHVVDEESGEQPPREEQITGQQITLAPFAVAIVSPGSK